MKLIEKPSVYFAGYQVLNEAELDRMMEDLGVTWESDGGSAAECLSETAGRICYLSFEKPRPGGNGAYLHHIKEVGHGSVLEHAVFNLVFTGVSRSLTHELVRHRAGFGYSQLSQRYVDESAVEAVVPPDLTAEVQKAREYLGQTRGADWTDMPLETVEGIAGQFWAAGESRPSTRTREAVYAGLVWIRNMLRNGDDYRTLAAYMMGKNEPELAKRYRLTPDLNLDDPDLRSSDLGLIAAGRTERRKAARGTARSVLPNATETKIFVTANARSLRHAIEQRCSVHAEVEIRRLFNAAWEILRVHSPNLFGDYRARQLPDGTYELTTPYSKV